MTVSQNELTRLNLSVCDPRLWLGSHRGQRKVGFLQGLLGRVCFFELLAQPLLLSPMYERAAEGQSSFCDFAT